ncbi:hypothetical protein E1A91_D11G347800v1 [Gossypium mustelinum]|uniref:Uncharacterized protein n=1 Tax=Gossypium mustelinum TaxID=34275 RepID=A0A5D2T108_GOSMU|nr:hypothetical protein E1A91_D11G347800v1 [Gossypium mustelinum]
MYVTRALSNYRRNAVELSAAAAPHSGIMVLRGREGADADEGKGLFQNGYAERLIKELPLPSNAMLINTDSDFGEYFYFIPVLHQPLSSNRYHVIHADGKYKGLAVKCSTEDDMSYCCSRRIIQDIEPKPFDHRDQYQQFRICSDDVGSFYAKPIVPHSFPPTFLRFKFTLFVKKKRVHHLQDNARGLDDSIRSQLPELDSGTNMIIGKWYTPFVFVKESSMMRVQMEKSLFYIVTLEKLWEKICSWENDGSSKGDVMTLNVEIKRKIDFLFGVEVLRGSEMDNEGFVWFRYGGEKLGLSLAVLEGMRWLEEVVGWVDGVERVERVVEIGGGRRRIDCYVLVERFALRRMDGTLVLNCDFRHTHEIRTKWE